MLYNAKMNAILCKLSVPEIPPCNDHPVWQRLTPDSRPYWGVDSFCNMDNNPNCWNWNLTELEWHGNEIYLDHSADISELVQRGLGIAAGWKNQLTAEYPEVAFDIFLYVDEGMEDVPPSVTLRLWAVRNGYHVINFRTDDPELHGVHNPALIITVNY